MRVLIAEDDPMSRRLLEVTLTKWGYEIVVARDGQEAWEIIQREDAPKLAIIDWMLPHLDGLELCRRIRKLQNRDYMYVILLTARGSKEDLVEGMGSGADDYVTKPFDADELRVRIRAAERILNLQSDLLAAQATLRELATHDALTGAWTRSAILDIIQRELARSQREGKAVGLAMVDLDHFKRVNDTHGHKTGDAVLREVAQRMSRIIRPYDSVGRYGGEEFLIVAVGCDAAGAAGQAERIRARIAETPFDAEGASLQLTASLGVASSANRDGVTATVLLQAADQALYRAKNAGRNRVEVASPTPAS
jgi:diguanylate cyclase (GGDEF)-like protein